MNEEMNNNSHLSQNPSSHEGDPIPGTQPLHAQPQSAAPGTSPEQHTAPGTPEAQAQPTYAQASYIEPSSQPTQRYDAYYATGNQSTQHESASAPGYDTAYQYGTSGYAAPEEQPSVSYAQPVSNYGGAGAAFVAKVKGTSGGKTFLIAFAGALVACVLAIGVSLGFGLIGGSNTKVNLGSSESSAIQANETDATLAEAVADKCLASVASIEVYGTQAASSGNSLFDFLYGQQQNNGTLQQIGMGSGVVLSEDGYIITNNHVISNGTEFKVIVEGETYSADLVGKDASSDIAVLKVKDGSGFKTITFGDSDNIRIGEWVMSIGSPFGLEQSVATGIVSATSRSQIMDAQSSLQQGGSGETTIYPNMIQTDAAINPGNSGGALVNENGELIGINTLITSYSGNYSGVGFAIPSNYAISIAQSIIEGKEPSYAQIGITMTTVNEQNARLYGFNTNSGAYISGIVDDSPASRADLKVGDIIVAFDGEKVASASDVMLDVRTKHPGDKVTLTIDRGGERIDVELTLGESQSKTPTTSQNSNNGNSSSNPYGLFSQ